MYHTVQQSMQGSGPLDNAQRLQGSGHARNEGPESVEEAVAQRLVCIFMLNESHSKVLKHAGKQALRVGVAVSVAIAAAQIVIAVTPTVVRACTSKQSK